MKRNKKYKLIIAMIFCIFTIFSNQSVNAIETVENPLYESYQELSEEEKQRYNVIPAPYLLKESIIIDSDGEFQQENKISLFRTRQITPTKYSLADNINIAAKDQKSLEICWAVTAYRCLETNLAIKGQGYYDFSELHLDYLTSTLYGGDRKLHSGGNFYDFIGYYKNKLGLVYEESLPLQTSTTTGNKEESEEIITEIKNKIKENGLEADSVTPVVKNITAKIFESIDITKSTSAEISAYQTEMKTFIQENGALEAYIFFDNFLECYSQVNNAFMSPKKEIIPNYGHGVNIIGWDDEFPKEKFTGKYQPSQDGAWIVTNSWGEEWGENGCFYISYEDYFVYQCLKGIIDAEIVSKTLDVSIVNLGSTWKDDVNTEPQNIAITAIIPDDTTTIKSIKVNGQEQTMENNIAFYEIKAAGEYLIKVEDYNGNIAEKTYTVSKMEVQEPSESIVLLGDVNQDKIRNITDVLILLRHNAATKSESVREKHPDWILTT